MCVCACVWEHSVLVFPSRSDVGLFLAVFSQEPLAGFNCLFFFPILYLCAWTSACLPSSPSVSLLLCWQKSADAPSRRSRGDTLSETCMQRLQSYTLDKISRIPSWKQCSWRREGVCLSTHCFSHCFAVFLLKEMGTQKEKTSLLFKTSREELKL